MSVQKKKFFVILVCLKPNIVKKRSDFTRLLTEVAFYSIERLNYGIITEQYYSLVVRLNKNREE